MYIEKLSEDEFTEDFLDPLLNLFGFEKTKYLLHNREKALEYGKDIRMFKYKLPTNHYLYFAAQVKIGNIHSSSSKETKDNIANILTQLRMFFFDDVFDEEINQNFNFNHAYLISASTINKYARNLLQKELKRSDRKILFLDKQDLIDLIKIYGLPNELQDKIEVLV